MPRPKTGRPHTGTVEKLPSGRYRVRYTGPDGARHKAPVTFEDVKAARLWLDRELRAIEYDPEGWEPPAARAATRKALALTFGEYAESWLIGRKVRGKPLADRTRDHYRDLLDRFLLPTFGDIALGSITPEQVDRWYELTAPETPTYRAHAYGLLRTILGTAVDRGLIRTANPAKVRGGGSTERARKIRPATLEEVGIIVTEMPERRRLIVVLAVWTALRFGELAELRRGDIDVKRRIIRVRRGVVRVRQTGEDGTVTMVRKVKAPKTDAGLRDVPIPPHVIADLRAHLDEHVDASKDALLFPSLNGGHLSSSALYGRESTLNADGSIKRSGHGYFEARRIAGRRDLRFHDLRHTGLTNAAIAGGTIAELMALAGHSTSGAAMRYQHAAQDRMQELAKRMSEIAGGEQP